MSGPRRSRERKNPLDCHERALLLLAVRQRSRRELQRRLLAVGFDAGEVDEELERLQAVGLLDDERFAREFAEHLVNNRLAGRRAVANALVARGVQRGTIERTLDELGVADEERALELARGRAGRLSGLPRDAAYRRLVSFLLRRGYESGLARRAAGLALEVDAAAE